MSDFDMGEVLAAIDRYKAGDEYTAQQAAHADCDFADKQVTCDRCGRTYVCSPWDDFYCAAEGDHCCERCLVSGRQIANIDPEAPLDEPVFHDPASGEDR